MLLTLPIVSSNSFSWIFKLIRTDSDSGSKVFNTFFNKLLNGVNYFNLLKIVISIFKDFLLLTPSPKLWNILSTIQSNLVTNSLSLTINFYDSVNRLWQYLFETTSIRIDSSPTSINLNYFQLCIYSSNVDSDLLNEKSFKALTSSRFIVSKILNTY